MISCRHFNSFRCASLFLWQFGIL